MNHLFKNIKKNIAKYIVNASLSYNTIKNNELIKKGKLKVGSYSYGVHNLRVRTFRGNDVDISIGNFVSISSNCEIITGGIHPIDWVSTFPLSERFLDKPFYSKNMPSSNGSVIIGSDVWIASNVTILSGVTIGDGAVIATNAVVTNDVPPYSIMGGVPAKLIKFRFNEFQISKLMEIKWWNWDKKDIMDNVDIISSSDIDGFIKKNYCIN